MITFSQDIVKALFVSGVTVEEGRHVHNHYMNTEYEKVDIPADRQPDVLEEKVRTASCKTEHLRAIHMLGVSLLMQESLNEENITGTIELPSEICSKLLKKVAEEDSYLILEDDIKFEILKRIRKVDATGIRREAILSQYNTIYGVIIKSEYAAAALALLKQADIPTYSVYSLITEIENTIVELSRSFVDKIAKLCVRNYL